MPSAADTRSTSIDTLPTTARSTLSGHLGSPTVAAGADDAAGAGSEPLRPDGSASPDDGSASTTPDADATTAYRYHAAASLDGFLADEDDDLEWLLSRSSGDLGPEATDTFMQDIGALVMGVRTYRWLVAHTDTWPYDRPSFVFTHQYLDPPEDSITVLSGPLEAHRERFEDAADGKDVWIVGGGDLATQFADAGMLDEITLDLAPVMLGSGRPLFTGQTDLELRDVDQDDGFVRARYALAACG